MDKCQIANRIHNVVKTKTRRLIVQDSDSKALIVCSRVAGEFYVFLRETKTLESVDSKAVHYINGSIRASMDWIFDLLYALSHVENTVFSYRWEGSGSYHELRHRCLHVYDELLSKDGEGPNNIQLLVRVIKHMILFMGMTYDYDMVKTCQYSVAIKNIVQSHMQINTKHNGKTRRSMKSSQSGENTN